MSSLATRILRELDDLIKTQPTDDPHSRRKWQHGDRMLGRAPAELLQMRSARQVLREMKAEKGADRNRIDRRLSIIDALMRAELSDFAPDEDVDTLRVCLKGHIFVEKSRKKRG